MWSYSTALWNPITPESVDDFTNHLIVYMYVTLQYLFKNDPCKIADFC